MTTNAGAEDMSRSSMGFTHQDHTGDSSAAVKRMFTPEFRNRLDAVVHFQSLSPEVVSHVVDKFVIELETQLEDKQVTIDVTEDARIWLAEHGFDRQMGARPIARLIQDSIKRPLAEELLFGRLAAGGHLKVGVKDNVLVFEFEDQKLADPVE